MAPGTDDVDIGIPEIAKMIESPCQAVTNEESGEKNGSPLSSEDEEPLTNTPPKSISSDEVDVDDGRSNSKEEDTTASSLNPMIEEKEEGGESEETANRPSSQESAKAIMSSDDEELSFSTSHNSSKKKVILSDDDEEDDLKKPESQPLRKSKAKIILSDDDSNIDDDLDLPDIHPVSKSSPLKQTVLSELEDEAEVEPISRTASQSNKKSSRIREMSSSSSEDEDLPDIHPLAKSSKTDLESSQHFPDRVLDPDIFGNNSESDDGGRRNSGGSSARDSAGSGAGSDHHSETVSKKKKGKEDVKKVAKRKASEQARAKTMQELASKTQKMQRDSRVQLPYHKPKQLTLDEFLKKRNKARVPVLESLIHSSSLGGLRNTISMKEDVLPIKDMTEPEAEPVELIPPSSVNNCKVVLDKIDSMEEVDVPSDEGFEMEGITVDNQTEEDTKDATPIVKVDMLPSESKDPNPDIVDLTDIIEEIKIDETPKDKYDVMCENASTTIPLESLSDESKPMPANCSKPNPTVEEQQLDLVDINMEDPPEKNQDIESNEPVPNTEKESKPTSESPTTFQEQEAELNAFLNAKKPKRKTVADLLKSMPGYDKIASFQPKLGGNCNPKAMIDFSDKKKLNKSKKEKGIQALMDRFVWHASSLNEVSPTKGSSVKLHITKAEKDSQGQLHTVLDEIDYITPAPTEDEEDIIAKLSRPSGTSPQQEQIPGQKLVRLKAALREQIWSKKAKEYQERLKIHAMYTEEKELEDKVSDDELPEDDEIIDEDDIELSDSEEEEEELELNDVPAGEKKKRKRLLYVEDEAEDEDADGEENSEEDDDESDSEAEQELKSLTDDQEIVDDIDDPLPAGQILKMSELDPSVEEEQTDKPSNDKSSQDFWSKNLASTPVSSTANTSKPGDVSENLAKLFTTNVESSEDLADLCSGKFPSQAPATPYETQNCFGFDDDSDDDQALMESYDNALAADSQSQVNQDVDCSNSDVNNGILSTPSGSNATPRISVLDGDTPKMTDKIVRSRSLGQRFEIEAKKMNDDENSTPKIVERVTKTKLDFSDLIESNSGKSNENEAASKSTVNPVDSDDEEDIGVKIIKKRKKLTFSDDEDEEIAEVHSTDVENEEDESNLLEEEDPEDDYEDEEAELEKELVKAQTPVRKGLFGNNGRLRKKFVENEAQLSGSEEGSEDEDERGLNFYEAEAGDDEHIDEDALKNEVERAHLKHLLDKDDRDIRLLQEEYLERGDLEGGNLRERKFRWNNIDEAYADELARMGDSDGEPGEDEEEVKRKFAEIEQRKWMLDHPELFETAEEESQKLFIENSRFLKLGRSTMKKIESFVENSSSFILNETSNSVPDPSISSLVNSNISFGAKMLFSKAKGNTQIEDEEDPFVHNTKAASQPLFASPDEPISKMKRGSFLSRGSPTLSRLAEINKVNDNPAAGSNVKNNSRNFVFAVVTPPDQASKAKVPKRQANSQAAGQPKKMPRMDRSFSNLDASSKDASIFKWM